MPTPSRRPPTRPERIGHRGAPREFLENTLPSFARALELGADAVELDVHRSADGVIVVHHDPSVRSPSSSAVPLVITDLTLSALRAIEIAPGARIPTLDEVLELTARSATVYVEIKGRGIERDVIEVIRRHQAEAAIHSFDHTAVATVRELAPEIPRGVLIEDRQIDPFALLTRTGARDLWPHHSLVDAPLLARAHAVGARVIAWTVNAPTEMSRLTALGVDGLCTDVLPLLPAI
jgi:glycerophosphoryl diester phosphodiesterase